ncbi:MAG TPA: hypothetical protein VNR18_11450 [Hyphomicrobiales bacterium]|nr:hypothetical protein [Hyphomicrobiales bacterium]
MAELSSTSKPNVPLAVAAVPPWALALLAAALYPSLLALFPLAMRHVSGAGSPALQIAWSGGAIAAMAVLFGVPLLALWALLKTPARATPRAILTRRILHVAFAVPPLYGFSRLWAGRLGVVEWHSVAWVVAALAAAWCIMRARDDKTLPASANPGTLLRSLHGITAVCLFVGFILAHVFNHAVALWSVEVQESWMTTLRLWYRAPWVEPILLGGFGLMALTGIPLMLRNTRTGGNLWRTLQSAAGVYIIVFLCSHVSAVLLARGDGRDTDWVFATGQNGLLAGSPNQIPYYVLSIAAVMVHVALGARMALLRRGSEIAHVGRAFSGLMWFAGLTTLWVTAAVLGVELAN